MPIMAGVKAILYHVPEWRVWANLMSTNEVFCCRTVADHRDAAGRCSSRSGPRLNRQPRIAIADDRALYFPVNSLANRRSLP